MTDYIVRWEIEVEADSPREAARMARGMQLGAEPEALVFHVRIPGGFSNPIDLSEEGEG